MKIIHLNKSDFEGGAARAAYRLHQGLRSIGYDSFMLVQQKFSDDASVIGPEGRIAEEIGRLRGTIDRLPLKLYPGRQKMVFSPAVIPDRLRERLRDLRPDIVHLHWVGAGFMRIETLAKFKVPLVWTLHDSWVFTGGCHVPFDCTRFEVRCGACPSLGSENNSDLSRKIWLRKKRAWKGVPVTFVTPSRWLAGRARASSLLSEARVEVIPNGLDTSKYRPHDKRTAREILSLPTHKKLILYGAINSTTDRNKGFHLLLPALSRLKRKDDIELVVCGSSAPKEAPDVGMKTHYLGRLHDDVTMALVYSAADVFAAPSLQENLSNMVMEALSCGTPCVAFNQGGMPDLVDHLKTGYLAQPYDPAEFAKGIDWALESRERYSLLCRQAREKIEETFSLEKVARRFAALYEELVHKP